MKIAIVTIVPQEATQPGALDGWAIYCDQCGHTGGSSLRGMADQQAMEHRHWHLKKDSERKQEMEMEVASQVRIQLWELVRFPASLDDPQNDEEMEILGNLGSVLNALLHPDDPEVQETLPAIRAGVDMFLNELRGGE